MTNIEIEIERDHGVKVVDWLPLVLTHVEYIKGDHLGLFFALTSLGPMSLMTSFSTVILFHRDLHTICFFIGFLLMEPFNILLKYKIRQSRPLQRPYQYGDFGMPSSHSQHLWFFATYSILFIIFRLKVSVVESISLFLILVTSATLVSYGRVYLKYHTWTQVFVGGLIGAALGALWFTLVHFALTPLFPAIVSWKLSEFLLVRDTTNIPDLISFEYNNVIRESHRLAAQVNESSHSATALLQRKPDSWK